MRVSRALFLLVLLTIALPAGIGAYSAAQQSAAGGETTTITLPNGQTLEVTAEMQAAMAARGFPAAGAAAEAETEIVSSIAVLGSVEAARSADLSFRTSGTVSEVYVQAGDYVEAGTVLARLDTTDAEVALRQAQLSLESAQINLQNLLEPPTETEIEQAQLSIASAQEAYSSAAGSDNESELIQLQLRYEQAVEAYDLAVQVRANMNADAAATALQDAAVGQASFNVEIARLNLEAAQSTDNSSLWAASIRIQIAQLQYDQLMAGSDAAQVSSAELSVAIAESNLASAEETLRRLEIISPIAGVITAVNIEAGSAASSGTAAITMTDLAQLYLTASIHELDLDQVSEGMTADIILDALPDETFTATIEQIAWIGTQSDGITQYTARFALQTADLRIRPGMTGEATITLSES